LHQNGNKNDPPVEKKIDLLPGRARVYCIITLQFSVSEIFIYLPMENWTLELQNRIEIGLAFGWSYYKKDEQFDYGEFILFLGFISLHFKYE
jgi:hypothetical protein